MRRFMPSNRVTQASTGLNLLTEGDIDQIHLGALEVLERTGVLVEADDALDVFADGGCKVDRETHIVKIPPHAVGDALAVSPARCTMCGRDPANDVVLGSSRPTFAIGGVPVCMTDLASGENRPGTKQDLADLALVADYLPNIDTLTWPLDVRDCGPEARAAHSCEAMVTNTTKHVLLPLASNHETQACLEIGALIVGGFDELRERPIVSGGAALVSPLTLPGDYTGPMAIMARAGIPITNMAMGMSGATSPCSLAGTLVQHIAEVLSGFVYIQLVERGSKVILSSATGAVDLRSGLFAAGSPEHSLVSAGVAQYAQRFGLLTYTTGLWSSSKAVDAQAAHEKTMMGLATALAGANIIFGAGLYESGTSMDLGMMVVDDEIIGMIRKFLEGIRVNDVTLAVEEIAKIGPGGEYLTSDYTYAHMHDLSSPALIDRQARPLWQADGSMDMADRANAKAREILAEHKPEPLPKDVLSEMSEIVARAEASAAVMG